MFDTPSVSNIRADTWRDTWRPPASCFYVGTKYNNLTPHAFLFFKRLKVDARCLHPDTHRWIWSRKAYAWKQPVSADRVHKRKASELWSVMCFKKKRKKLDFLFTNKPEGLTTGSGNLWELYDYFSLFCFLLNNPEDSVHAKKEERKKKKTPCSCETLISCTTWGWYREWL